MSTLAASASASGAALADSMLASSVAGASSSASAASVAAVLQLFASHGNADYVGEAVSQSEHAAQAASLAARSGAAPLVIAAALLHDVGHMLSLADPNLPRMGDLGAVSHEALGAAFLLRLGFPARLAALVRRHVDAKRFLTARDPAYLSLLSEASRGTLAWQGGPMGEEEAAAFEADPLRDTILAMRTWDEGAKLRGAQVPPPVTYAGMLQALVEEAAQGEVTA